MAEPSPEFPVQRIERYATYWRNWQEFCTGLERDVAPLLTPDYGPTFRAGFVQGHDNAAAVLAGEFGIRFADTGMTTDPARVPRTLDALTRCRAALALFLAYDAAAILYDWLARKLPTEDSGKAGAVALALATHLSPAINDRLYSDSPADEERGFYLFHVAGLIRDRLTARVEWDLGKALEHAADLEGRDAGHPRRRSRGRILLERLPGAVAEALRDPNLAMTFWDEQEIKALKRKVNRRLVRDLRERETQLDEWREANEADGAFEALADVAGAERSAVTLEAAASTLREMARAANLSARELAVLELRYVYDLDHAAIAERLSAPPPAKPMSPSTSRVTLNHALAKLRKLNPRDFR